MGSRCHFHAAFAYCLQTINDQKLRAKSKTHSCHHMSVSLTSLLSSHMTLAPNSSDMLPKITVLSCLSHSCFAKCPPVINSMSLALTDTHGVSCPCVQHRSFIQSQEPRHCMQVTTVKQGQGDTGHDDLHKQL